MLNLQLARKYSKAIFEIAQEEKKLEAYGKELETVRKELFNSDEVRSFFRNPQVQPEAKKELLKKCFKGELSDMVYHFLLLLVDKRRIGIFEAIEEDFRALSNQAQGIVIADVTTARGIGGAQQAKLAEKLASVTGKKVKLRLHENKDIIGGVVVKIGDKRIDGSVTGRLENLKRELLGSQ
ncbi:MAG: ATP synthase F1 subunit delta [Selenomonadaceae bacterium]|nr:ATP synthase F1 subunit delta [Selenomonadaceae bacterium]HCB92839.1 F0F1 ATP synthase subunit delta [Selenomonas sp.]